MSIFVKEIQRNGTKTRFRLYKWILNLGEGSIDFHEIYYAERFEGDKSIFRIPSKAFGYPGTIVWSLTVLKNFTTHK